MSKSSGKNNRQEETAPSAEAVASSTDAEEREAAVEELDEALDALPDGGDDAETQTRTTGHTRTRSRRWT